MAARCGGVRARKSVRTRRTVGWCALGGAGDEIGDGVRVMLMDASIDGVCESCGDARFAFGAQA